MNWSHVFWQVPYKVCMDGWNGIGDFLYKTIFSFVYQRSWKILWPALGETIYMTLLSTILSYIIGLALGVLLVVTRKGGIKPMPRLNTVLGTVINFLRSIPFIILLVRQTVVAHDKTPVNFCVFISFCQNLAVILVRLVKDSVLLKPFCLMVEFLKFFQFVFGILSPESLQRLLMLICCLLQLPYFFTDLSLVLQKLSCR